MKTATRGHLTVHEWSARVHQGGVKMVSVESNAQPLALSASDYTLHTHKLEATHVGQQAGNRGVPVCVWGELK